MESCPWASVRAAEVVDDVMCIDLASRCSSFKGATSDVFQVVIQIEFLDGEAVIEHDWHADGDAGEIHRKEGLKHYHSVVDNGVG